MSTFLLLFVFGAVLTAVAALILVTTTASASDVEGQPVRERSKYR